MFIFRQAVFGSVTQLILEKKPQAAGKVPAALPDGCLQHFRVGGREIGGADHIQNLVGRRVYYHLVFATDALDPCRCLSPPILAELVALGQDIEWPPFPEVAAHATLDGRCRSLSAFVKKRFHAKNAEARRFLQEALSQPDPRTWR